MESEKISKINVILQDEINTYEDIITMYRAATFFTLSVSLSSSVKPSSPLVFLFLSVHTSVEEGHGPVSPKASVALPCLITVG